MALVINLMSLTSSFNSSLTNLGKNSKPEGLNILMHRRSNGSPIIRCSVTTTKTTTLSPRKSANYQPNLWNYEDLQSLEHDYSDVRYEDRAKKLKEEVRRMIKYYDNKGEILETMELIDHVKRLGLGYHFEKEISKSLERLTTLFTPTTLHEAALGFRLLREYGFHVSPDVFESFMDENGDFKTSLIRDVKGMLSLYEASFLGYEGEHILNKAKAFASFHLRNLLNNENTSNNRSTSVIIEQVNHALELPLHRRIQKLEARWYIESYGKTQDANMILIQAAKLDFNLVQSTLQEDLREMSRWWKQIGLASELSFSRDRLMECFFWCVGLVFEPEFSDVRKGLTKVASLITTIDDVYDVYGTLDELELFTAAVESWDIKAIKVLPNYMKICFLALYNTINELAYDALRRHGKDILPYLTKAWSHMLKAFLQEAKWCQDKQVPKFEEYLNNAWVSVSGVVVLTHTYFLLDHNITNEALDSLQNYHNSMLSNPSMIFRLCNDLGTAKAELERGESASSIGCYMHENGANEEDACKHIKSLVDETWKKMNKDRTNSPFSKPFVEIAINLARISHFTYQYGDAHGAPDGAAKNRIRSLIIEPIAL